jgi:hypothetical protein
MASHGGMREGSGRPAGAVNKATSARIAAANAILDRGYGRPTKTTSLEVNAPFVPTRIELVAYSGRAD